LGQSRRQDHFLFVQLDELPSTIFRYDIASREAKIFRSPEISGFKADDYETKEVFYSSKMARAFRCSSVPARIEAGRNNPVLLSGYGGFNVSKLRNSTRCGWLAGAGLRVRVGKHARRRRIREKWHEAGTKLKKQNVFDDFIAAGEWLIANKYTSREKLAILGGSNGGLLIGAAINQRPELFRAAVALAGVMDMLRFQKFTIGGLGSRITDRATTQTSSRCCMRIRRCTIFAPG